LTASSPLPFDLGVSPVDAIAVTLISLALHGIDQIISHQWPLGTIELYFWKLSSHMVKKQELESSYAYKSWFNIKKL
jgi:hypothetical protein